MKNRSKHNILNPQSSILNPKRGAAMIVATMFFLAISLTVILGLSLPVSKQISSTSRTLHSRTSFFLADTLLEDIVYRFRQGMNVDSTETLTIDGNTATANVTDILGGTQKEIESEGIVRNLHRKVTAHLLIGTGSSFNYGLQAGNGGIDFAGSSSVTGNVYANGPIRRVSMGVALNAVYGDVVSATASGLIKQIDVAGDAYANTLDNSKVAGDAYYKNEVGINIITGTRNSPSDDQPAVDLPISDATLDQWELDAEAGGVITGPCPYVINTTQSIGPIKIECDVEIRGTPPPIITLEGAIWIEGNLTITQSPTIQIDPSMGAVSVPIIVDDPANRSTGSTVVMNNSATFAGSGLQGSFVFVISRNTSAENGGNVVAIDYNNNATGDLILYSNHGKVSLGNGVGLKEVTAWRIHLSNNASITYDSGLANQIFNTGPSGTYTRESWREIE